MRHAQSQILTSRPLITAGLCLLNLLLIGSWAWFALRQMPLLVAVLAAFAAFAAEALLWVALEESRRDAAHAGDSLDRVASLLGRSSETLRQSIRDDTTGLYSRWYLDMRVHEESERCKRYSQSMAVVVLRLGAVELSGMSDDSWQRRTQEAAQRCINLVRKIDLSGSLAPIEFAICLVQCDRDGAQVVIDRMIGELGDYRLDTGIAVFPDDGCEPRALIDLARVRSRSPAGTGMMPVAG